MIFLIKKKLKNLNLMLRITKVTHSHRKEVYYIIFLNIIYNYYLDQNGS